jgi:hypothetical protein
MNGMAHDAVVIPEQQRAPWLFQEHCKHDYQECGDTDGTNDNIFSDILVTRASFHCIAGRCGTYSRMIAVTGQLSTACWQSQVSQPFGSMTHALSSLCSKTIGQSSEQSPQPMQRSRSTRGAAIMTAILSHVS